MCLRASAASGTWVHRELSCSCLPLAAIRALVHFERRRPPSSGRILAFRTDDPSSRHAPAPSKLRKLFQKCPGQDYPLETSKKIGIILICRVDNRVSSSTGFRRLWWLVMGLTELPELPCSLVLREHGMPWALAAVHSTWGVMAREYPGLVSKLLRARNDEAMAMGLTARARYARCWRLWCPDDPSPGRKPRRLRAHATAQLSFSSSSWDSSDGESGSSWESLSVCAALPACPMRCAATCSALPDLTLLSDPHPTARQIQSEENVS